MIAVHGGGGGEGYWNSPYQRDFSFNSWKLYGTLCQVHCGKKTTSPLLCDFFHLPDSFLCFFQLDDAISSKDGLPAGVGYSLFRSLSPSKIKDKLNTSAATAQGRIHTVPSTLKEDKVTFKLIKQFVLDAQ